MFKVVLSNLSFYKRIINIPWLHNFVCFNYTRLNDVGSEKLFVQILNEIRMGNGTYKTTNVNRLRQVDEELLKLLKLNVRYSVHDVAVSDGITSVELFYLLKENNISFDMTISDKYSELIYQRSFFSTAYFDFDKKHLFSNVAGLLGDKAIARRFILSKWLGKLASTEFDTKRKSTSVPLLNPRTKELIHQKALTFKTFDLFEGTVVNEEFDIVRAMNILNAQYFSREQLISGIQNLIRSLRNNGIFIVGRTDPANGRNDVTFYRKTTKGLEVTTAINNGSEIDHIVSAIDFAGEKHS